MQGGITTLLSCTGVPMFFFLSHKPYLPIILQCDKSPRLALLRNFQWLFSETFSSNLATKQKFTRHAKQDLQLSELVAALRLSNTRLNKTN